MQVRGHWTTVKIEDHTFLGALAPLFPAWGQLESFSLKDEKFGRIACQGLVTAIGQISGKKVGVLYNDFRVSGGSFHIANSQKANAFIGFCAQNDIPLVMAFNTIGVGIMEGRNVFMDAFSTIPSLFDFRAKHLPLITIALGKCLGLGAILFQMGHYRIAVREKAAFNLTGPEVIRMFFGGKLSFDALASGEHQVENNELVHELQDNSEAAFAKAHAMLHHVLSDESFASSRILRFPGSIPIGEYLAASDLNDCDSKMFKLLEQVGDSALEVYEQMNPVVRTFLVRRGRRTVGVFVNPPGHPNNLVTVETLNRYDAGLSLFKAMGIPIISFLDTPGIDPRFKQQDQDIVRLIVRVAKRIIEYPHGHMGVVLGRAFGGATTLAFPKNFRSQRCVAVKGCQMGVMSESILEQVLENSPRLLETRREMRKLERDDLGDLIANGVIDGFVDHDDLYGEVEYFLKLADVEAEQRATMRHLHDELRELPVERMQPALRHLRPVAGFVGPLARPRWREGARAQSRRLPPKYSR
jgi:acetyl-CoA carboxylase carboxyltransferase component